MISNPFAIIWALRVGTCLAALGALHWYVVVIVRLKLFSFLTICFPLQAIAYAERFQKVVLSLVLRGIFLLRKSDIDWLYERHGGARFIYPDGDDYYFKRR
jgi:hypothetical protein